MKLSWIDRLEALSNLSIVGLMMSISLVLVLIGLMVRSFDGTVEKDSYGRVATSSPLLDALVKELVGGQIEVVLVGNFDQNTGEVETKKVKGASYDALFMFGPEKIDNSEFKVVVNLETLDALKIHEPEDFYWLAYPNYDVIVQSISGILTTMYPEISDEILENETILRDQISEQNIMWSKRLIKAANGRVIKGVGGLYSLMEASGVKYDTTPTSRGMVVGWQKIDKNDEGKKVVYDPYGFMIAPESPTSILEDVHQKLYALFLYQRSMIGDNA